MKYKLRGVDEPSLHVQKMESIITGYSNSVNLVTREGNVHKSYNWRKRLFTPQLPNSQGEISILGNIGFDNSDFSRRYSLVTAFKCSPDNVVTHYE